jgi:oligopeptide transport system permease protein
VFIGTTLLIFLMVYALPGDPLKAMWGDRPADPAQLAQMRHEYHMDLPVWQQYGYYLWDLVQGNLGRTFGGREVSDVLKETFPITIRLALLAFAVEAVLGLLLGLVAGMRRGRWADKAVLIVTLLLISIPVFVLGYIFQTVFGNTLNWVTPTVQDSMNLGQLMLPAIVLGSVSLAYVARLTRTSIAENLGADYMRTAVAKGLPKRRIITNHLLRNSLIPVVTFLGTDLGALMGGAIVTEGIFNVHGVGLTLYQAIARSESPTVVGIVSVLVVVYLAASLIVDLLYAVLDPRIRYA